MLFAEIFTQYMYAVLISACNSTACSSILQGYGQKLYLDTFFLISTLILITSALECASNEYIVGFHGEIRKISIFHLKKELLSPVKA